MEEHKAQHGPQQEQKIRFILQRVGRSQVGQHQMQPEADHDGQADDGQRALAVVPAFPRQLDHGGADQGVDQRRADGGHVHDPADGGPAQQAKERRHARHQRDGLGRGLMLVQGGISLGQDAVLAQGVKQSAHGGDIADQRGDDQRQQGQHQYAHARIAHVAVSRVEGRQALDALQVPPVPDIFQPGAVLGRIGGGGEHGDKDVQHSGKGHRNQQDPGEFCARKAHLLRGMRDVFKADERPGRYEGDADDLGNHGLIRHEIGLKGQTVPDDRAHEAHRDAQRKQYGHDRHHARHGPLARGAQPGHQQKRRDGKQRLSKIHIVAEYGIKPAKSEFVAQKIAGEQRQRRGVCPEDGHIGQRQEPRDQKAVVIAEHLPGIGVRAAGFRVNVHHVGVVDADNQHNQPTHRRADGAAPGTSLSQIGIAGHDQGTPADAGAYGKRPCPQGGKVATQQSFFLHCAHAFCLNTPSREYPRVTFGLHN